jgi:hypothetical protein
MQISDFRLVKKSESLIDLHSAFRNRLALESLQAIGIRNDPNYLECGGKRSATPLWVVSTRANPEPPNNPKRRRRFALPAHSKSKPSLAPAADSAPVTMTASVTDARIQHPRSNSFG